MNEEQLFRQKYNLAPNADISSHRAWQMRQANNPGQNVESNSFYFKNYLTSINKQGGNDAMLELQKLGLVSNSNLKGGARNKAIEDAYRNMDVDQNIGNQVMSKIGLSTSEQKEAFKSGNFTPASGVTAQMRASNPAQAQAQYDKIDPGAPGSKLPSNSSAPQVGAVQPKQQQSAQAPQEPAQPVGEQLNIQRNLTPGMNGEDVKALQNFLIQQGQSISSATGFYGKETKAAVEAWQRANGIMPNNPGDYGFFGPKSRAFTQGGIQTSETTTAGNKVSGTSKTMAPMATEPGVTQAVAEYANYLKTKTFDNYTASFSDQIGLKDLQKQISTASSNIKLLSDKKVEEASDINNNPWISETQRIRKLQGLDSKYESKLTNAEEELSRVQKQYDSSKQEAQFAAKLAIDQQNSDREFEFEAKKFAFDLQKETNAMKMEAYKASQPDLYFTTLTSRDEDGNSSERIVAYDKKTGQQVKLGAGGYAGSGGSTGGGTRVLGTQIDQYGNPVEIDPKIAAYVKGIQNEQYKITDLKSLGASKEDIRQVTQALSTATNPKNKLLSQSFDEGIRKINEVLSSSGLRYQVGTYGLFGRNTLMDPNAIADKAARQHFIAAVHQLVDQKTIDKLLEVKAAGGTFGALQEKELELLRNAASKINEWETKPGSGNWAISEELFKKELNQLKSSAQFFKDYLNQGGAATAGGQQHVVNYNGRDYSVDSDGEMTPI